MDTATTRLLDALRASQGGITDYRAGKLLGVSTSAVSRWRMGQGHMSTANVVRACELAGLDSWEWNIRIAAEREHGPDGDLYREAVQDLERVRRGEDPSPSGLFALLTRGVRAAAILAALLIGGIAVNSGTAHAGSAVDGYILCARRRRRQSQNLRLWRRFLFVFPVAVLAGCANVRPLAEYQHLSHATQHVDHKPIQGGYNVLSLGVRWRPTDKVTVDLLEGYTFQEMHERREVFTGRVTIEF